MDFEIKLKPSGADETNDAADAVKNVRTELDQIKGKGTVKTQATGQERLRELARSAQSARENLARLEAERKNLDKGSSVNIAQKEDLERRISGAKQQVSSTQKRFLRAGGAAFDAKAYDKAVKDEASAAKKAEAERVKAVKEAEREKEQIAKQASAAAAAREKTQSKGTGNAKQSLSSLIAVKTVLAQQGVEALKWAAGMVRANFQLALGAHGGARLAMISAQASMNWRRLFMGTNPKPLLDAIQRTSQLIDPRTFTGKELGGLLTRSADRIFVALSKAEPYVRLFFKGMLLGGLQVEGMWLDLLIAAQPVLNMFPKGVGLMSTFEAGALAVKGAVVLMGIGVAAGAVKAAAGMLMFGKAAVAATGPLLPAIAVVLAWNEAIKQGIELYKQWDENSLSQIATKLKGDLGFASKEETEAAMSKRQGIVTGDDYDRRFKLGKYAEKPPASATPLPKGADKQAAAAGPPIGKNLGLGMLQGMKDTEAKVAAGGRDLVLAAEGGAKSAAEIKSPARKWRREIGQNLGEGAALGLEDSAARMEGAAASLIPGAPGVGGGALGRGAVMIQQIGPFYGMPAGGEEQVRRWVSDALDDMAERLGALA